MGGSACSTWMEMAKNDDNSVLFIVLRQWSSMEVGVEVEPQQQNQPQGEHVKKSSHADYADIPDNHGKTPSCHALYQESPKCSPPSGFVCPGS